MNQTPAWCETIASLQKTVRLCAFAIQAERVAQGVSTLEALAPVGVIRFSADAAAALKAVRETDIVQTLIDVADDLDCIGGEIYEMVDWEGRA